MFIGPSLFHYRVIIGRMEGAGEKTTTTNMQPKKPEQKITQTESIPIKGHNFLQKKD